MQLKNNRINQTIETTLKNLSEIIDVNTAIGTPINTKDGVVIPVSKITVGLLSGGGEYGKVSIFKNGNDLPFSGGNGSIISIKPCGFLIGDKNGYKMVAVSESSYEKIIDKASDFIEKMKNNWLWKRRLKYF